MNVIWPDMPLQDFYIVRFAYFSNDFPRPFAYLSS